MFDENIEFYLHPNYAYCDDEVSPKSEFEHNMKHTY